MQRWGLVAGLSVALLSAPVCLAQTPGTLSEPGVGWQPFGLRMGLDLSDVTAHPGDPGLAAVAALDGTVWLTTDGGGQWVEVLPALPVRLGETSSDERIRREFEAAVADVFDSPSDLEDEIVEGGDDPESDADLLASEIDRIAEEVSIQIQSELRSNPGFFLSNAGLEEQQQVLAGRKDTARPRVWFVGDLVIVTRADGIWRSDDRGENWNQTFDLPATALVASSREIVAGTRDGMRYSDDGVVWRDRLDGTEGLFVYDLEIRADGGLIAGTSDGMWASPLGERWHALGVVRGHVFSVLPSPTDPDVEWFTANDTVYRASEDGELVEGAFTDDLPDGVDLLLWHDELIVATAQGPWESTDDGRTWTRAERGLTLPRTRAITLLGTELVIATREGLFHLAEYEAGDLRGAIDEWISLESLLHASLSRTGMADIVAPGSRITASLLPQFRVELRGAPGRALRYTDASGTLRDADGQWSLLTFLEWQPDGRKRSSTVEPIIVDGEVLIDDGRDRALLASRVGRRASEYRGTIVRLMSEIYATRVELVGTRSRYLSAPIQARVEHELRIQQLEAELDALTDGAVSRYETGLRMSEEP